MVANVLLEGVLEFKISLSNAMQVFWLLVLLFSIKRKGEGTSSCECVMNLCFFPISQGIWEDELCRSCSQTQQSVCSLSGGLDVKTQEAALRSGPDILIATPGRLIDHLHNCPSFHLSSVEVLILDEADR